MAAPRKKSPSRSARRTSRRYLAGTLTFASVAAAGAVAYNLHTDPAYQNHVQAMDGVRGCVARIPGMAAGYPRDFMSYWMQKFSTDFVASVQGKGGLSSPEAAGKLPSKLYGKITIDFEKGTLSLRAEERDPSQGPYWGDMSGQPEAKAPSALTLLPSKQVLDEISACHREALLSLVPPANDTP